MSDRAIDKIVAHYAKTKDRRLKVRSDAWGMDVWFTPWTLGEKDRVFSDGGVWRHRSSARLLIVKALDAKGNLLFADVEETELLNEADPDEVVRVANAILAELKKDLAAGAEGGEAPKAPAQGNEPEAS
ncbi:hypothetical protein [Reyranella sp.]|uniref:hypothetical protein n=1 Tax=Reyranella sp. TaxID=1929291 RepID=UPI003F704849